MKHINTWTQIYPLWRSSSVSKGSCAVTCLGKHSQFSSSELSWQSSVFFSTDELRPFSCGAPSDPWSPAPAELLSICRTTSWFKSTWKSAETFLPSRMSSRETDTKKGSIWGETAVIQWPWITKPVRRANFWKLRCTSWINKHWCMVC